MNRRTAWQGGLREDNPGSERETLAPVAIEAAAVAVQGARRIHQAGKGPFGRLVLVRRQRQGSPYSTEGYSRNGRCAYSAPSKVAAKTSAQPVRNKICRALTADRQPRFRAERPIEASSSTTFLPSYRHGAIAEDSISRVIFSGQKKQDRDGPWPDLNPLRKRRLVMHAKRAIKILFAAACAISLACSVNFAAAQFPPNPQSAAFTGAWCAQGDPTKHASISDNGAFLSLTNENGDTSTGQYQGQTGIVAPGWQFVSGTLSPDGSQINWSNGTFWARCNSGGGGGNNRLNLTGTWYHQGEPLASPAPSGSMANFSSLAMNPAPQPTVR